MFDTVSDYSIGRVKEKNLIQRDNVNVTPPVHQLKLGHCTLVSTIHYTQKV